jgi:hypothetical protein
MLLFETILTYVIEIIWDRLTLKDVTAMEKVKSRFLKATLCISRFTPMRLAYELAKETFLREDSRTRFLLPTAKNSMKQLERRERKSGQNFTVQMP